MPEQWTGRPVHVDATLGLGGHAEAVLAAHPDVRLIGLDRDPEALARQPAAPGAVRAIGSSSSTPSTTSCPTVLSRLALDTVDSVLFDLGVSSMQLDDADRGFAYAQDAPLDMRMDPTTGITAEEVVNTYPAGDLARVLRVYGEEKFASRIASARSCANATRTRITSSARLAELVRDSIPAPARRTGGHPAKRTFQALRIEVNGELAALEAALPAALDALALGGRIVVMSYHSLEDRIVKRALRRRGPGPPHRSTCRSSCPEPARACGCSPEGAELPDRGRGRGESAGRVGQAARRRTRRPRRADAAMRRAERPQAPRRRPEPHEHDERGTAQPWQGDAGIQRTSRRQPRGGGDERDDDPRPHRPEPGLSTAPTVDGANALQIDYATTPAPSRSRRPGASPEPAAPRRAGAPPPVGPPGRAAVGAAAADRVAARAVPRPWSWPGRRRRARRARPEHEDQRERVPPRRPSRQQAALDLQEQQLTQDLADAAVAGQPACGGASRLGLVPAGTPAFISLPDGRVVGVPQPGHGQPDATSAADR